MARGSRRRELLVVLALSALSAQGSQLAVAPSGQETLCESGSMIRDHHRTCLLPLLACGVRCLRGGGGILPQLRGGWDEENEEMSAGEELFGLQNSSGSDSSSEGGFGPVSATQMRAWELELIKGDPAVGQHFLPCLPV
jgi:hypothetical protein